MKLRPDPFRKIRRGTKTVELRLNDEKRQKLSVGDDIIFSCTDDEEEVTVRIVSLIYCSSFRISISS